MEPDKSIFLMEMSIEANTKTEDSMGSAATNGNPKEPSIKGILKMALGMVKENGKEEKQNTTEAIVKG